MSDTDLDEAQANAPPKHQVMHPVTGEFRGYATQQDAAEAAMIIAGEHPGCFVAIYTHATSIRARDVPTPESGDAHG